MGGKLGKRKFVELIVDTEDELSGWYDRIKENGNYNIETAANSVWRGKGTKFSWRKVQFGFTEDNCNNLE